MSYITTPGWRLGLAVTAAVAVAALGGDVARAQEANTSAPPPLQFPTLPTAGATGNFPMLGVRAALLEGGNVELCKILTREVNPSAVFPPDFTFAQCDPAIAAKVNGNRGSVRWASGARPSECGGNCVGRPTNGRTLTLDRPNRRFASVLARLMFTVVNVGPTPFDRDVIFPVEVRFDCRVDGGLTVGEVRISSVVSQPFADEPGFGESVADFLLGPLNISRSIENGIRAALGGGGTTPGPSLGRCSSIGARPDPVQFQSDSFVWDSPPQAPPHGPLTSVAALPDTTATVVFDSIVRNRTLERSPPMDPLQFFVYVNGNLALIPRIGTLTLPPGGRHDQKYCKTVNVVGAENLQILVADNVGGAVWSQFPRRADFGNGPPRKMTTGRTFFVAPMPIAGAPQPPGGDKPQAFVTREFEVQYHVEFHPPVAAPRTGTTGSGVHGGTHGPLGGGVATTGTVPPPAPPCIKI
jgi:hypothetical protein